MQQLLLEVDETDMAAIHEAIAIRRTFMYSDGGVILPDGTENTEGGIIAEICRGWMEWQAAHRGKGVAT